ncbi:MAG: SLC13 family permease [Pelistega sp.]|nr:SLC13 family permease [Pelistega sp.]
MTIDIMITLGITLIAIVLFATEKIRIDAVAILVLTLLTLSGQIDVSEALSGFSNSATITIAAMFVLATGLKNSGALDGVGDLLSRVKSPWLFLLTLFIITAFISPFVNNTAVVAVFIPIVIAAAHNIGLSPSKALIPLSYVSQMAGVSTLIGTSTNLLVDAIAKQQGLPGFSMFAFTPLGLIFLFIGGAYLLLLNRWLLPESTSLNSEEIGHGKYVSELKVPADSPLIGKMTDELSINETYDVYILSIIRGTERLSTPSHQVLQADDILLVRGEVENLMTIKENFALTHSSTLHHIQQEKNTEIMVAEVMIAPNSHWLNSNTVLLNRQWNRHMIIWGMQRRGKMIRERLRTLSFQVGDILLMSIPKEDLEQLKSDRNFILLSESSYQPKSNWRAYFSMAIMAAVVITSALGIAPIVITSLLGAVAMTMTGCLGDEDSYHIIDWRVLILLAGLFPLGIAMTNSGAAQFIADHTIAKAAVFGPIVALAILYLMTMVLTEFMSNAGTAVLLTPIAISTAQSLDVSPTPFVVAVVFAAATSFVTPVGYQTNAMVYGAGGYKFTDFIKVGLPLNLIFYVLGIIFIPLFWPF